MKRLISIILLVSMIMSIVPVSVFAVENYVAANTNTEIVPQENIFKDVSESDWFYDSVRYVLEQGIFKGTGKDTFSPQGHITRAMYVTIIGRVAGVDPADYSYSSGFNDVDEGAYYAPYVAWAVERGITNGVGNNRFAPDRILNREQMAVLTVRYFESYEIEYNMNTIEIAPPTDLSDISTWAQDSVLKLWRAGIFIGDNNGRFNPKSNARRAEAAAFTKRVNKIVVTWQEERGKASPIITSDTTLTPTPPAPTLPSTPTPSIPTPSIPTPSIPTPSTPTPNDDEGEITYYTVYLESNGGTNVSPITVRNGRKISNLPIPRKENAIFLGWYKTSNLQGDAFTNESIVTKNITLYAKYLEVEDIREENLNDFFTMSDQEPNLTFSLSSLDNSMTATDVKSAIALEIASGSELVELIVSGSNGSYTVRAANGFTEGASYNLILVDDRLFFTDRDTRVRRCSFTIKKEEIFNLKLNADIIFIPDTDVINITKNNVSVESLSVPLITLSDDGGGDDSTTGTFTYIGSLTLKVGDVLCIYSGEMPEVESNSSYLHDDIAYITVTGINGNEITFSNTEPNQVLFIPDMIPIYVGDGHTLTNYINDGNSGSFTASLFDLKFEEYSYLGLSANTRIDVGDFLILSVIDFNEAEEVNEDTTIEDELEETEIIYAVVTSVETTGTMVRVEFEVTTFDEMKNSASFYSRNLVNGEQMLKDVNIEELQSRIIKQINDSGFDNQVAMLLTTLAISTDGFNNVADTYGGIDSLQFTLDDGSTISLNEYRMLASKSKKIEIKDKKVNARINTRPENFDQGVRCEITLALKIEIQAGNDNVIEIQLTANFVEEIKLSVNASGREVWRNRTIRVLRRNVRIPYIADYSVSAEIDLFNYTAIDFKAVVSTKGGTNSTDVTEQIHKLFGKSDEKEVTNGVKELYELYSDMMTNSTDWIEIFDQQIIILPMSLLFGTIQAQVTVNVVAAANINVAIGSNYESMSGTRYIVWARLEAKEAGSSTIDLMDKTYTFQFYVMGTLGLRAGIKVEVAVGLFSLKLNSIGIEAESGLFTRLYGFFFYEKKSVNNKTTSTRSGALYFELGAYLETKFKAQVLDGKYKYNPTLYENEWTILSAGQRFNVFDFAYEEPDSIVFNNQEISFSLPNTTFNMIYLDLREGTNSTKTFSIDDYIIQFSDNRFTLDGNQVIANVPTNIKYLVGDMTVTWKRSPLAFTSIPISRTYRLIWDTLDRRGYTISFDSNGGSFVGSIRKQYGEAVSAPQDPVRIGFTFAGWYTDETLLTPYTFTTMGWENITLYAKWVANNNTRYRVEHYQQSLTNSNRFTLVETQNLTGTTGSSITPAVKSYTGFTSPALRTVTIAADGSTVIEYRYTRNSYTLTFVPNNGGSNITRSLRFGATITPPVLQRRGHTFAGWDKPIAETMPAANITYSALWNKGTYPVIFNSTGGSTPSSITVTFGERYGTLPTPIREGYTFMGWYNNVSDNIGIGTRIEENTIVNITSLQILYAKWAGLPNIPYKVNHYLQNIENNQYPEIPELTESFTGTAGTEVTPAVKTFEGFRSPHLRTVTILGDGSTVINYYYTRNSYILTFKPQNGEVDIVSNVKYGAAIPTPIVTREGHTFTGWTPQLETMPADNVTLTANWIDNSRIPYIVKHYLEDLSGGTYELIETENLIGELNSHIAPAVKNFSGFTSPVPQTVTIAIDGSTVVEYYYTRNSYTMTIKKENGEADTVTTVKFGATITLPVDLTNTGYTFSGWNPTPVASMPAQNITYTAIWTPKTNTPYTVKHYIQDLDGVSYTLVETEALTGTTGSSITPAVKNYNGFTSPVPQTVTIVADGSTVVEYYYTRNSYTMTIKKENGEADTVTTVKFGATVTLPVNLTKTGYTFSGWNPTPVATMPAQNITYIAIWTANTYTITFDSTGGTTFGPRTVIFGSPYNELPTPTRTDYIFEGWYDGMINGNGSGNLITASTIVSTPSNHVLYARWRVETLAELEAEMAVEQAEISESHADFAIAQGLVTALANSVVKENLQARLDAIVVVYNLSLNDGRIIIYPDRYVIRQINNSDIISVTTYVSTKYRFIITGSLTASTPLQIFNDTNSPVIYDITLRNATITGTTWATAMRLDYDSAVTTRDNPNNLIVNLKIEGTVRIRGHNHPGLQAGVQSIDRFTINLTGTANSIFHSANAHNVSGTSVSNRIILNINQDNIQELKVGGTITSNITEAYNSGPLDIIFK